jgi:hypothetical protein
VNKTTNIPASVRARLLDLAKREDRPYDELLQYYVIERFLYRLSKSPHADEFVLKGALMPPIWGGPLTRSTRDVALLGITDSSIANLISIFQDCFKVDVPEDGVRFDPESLEGEEITVEAKYQGARIRFLAFIDTAKISLQVDVGFGDLIIPAKQLITYPTLLEFEAPMLLGYTPESTIAEKFQAMVAFDIANTRMKDFYDLWLLALNRNFEGTIPAEAMKATFTRRETSLLSEPPPGMTERFYGDPAKQNQWKGFLRKVRVSEDIVTLEEIIKILTDFLMPPMKAIYAGKQFNKYWPAGGGWRESKSSKTQS